METLLLVITAVSTAITVASLTVAYRQRRHERERSDARVAALAQAAETHGRHDGGWKQVAGEWQWTTDGDGIWEPGVAGNADAGSGISPDATELEVEPLFGTVQRKGSSRNHLPVLAAAALIAVVGGAVVFFDTAPAGDSGGGTVVQASHSEPLELVALGHVRETSSLTITGMVRNPPAGQKLEGLTAVISLLDRNGTLVSTKDVPLDYRALGPGEEAPFKVAVPEPGRISRYRVSFRAGTDVVPHVDRRTDTKLASAL
jgi:hypothetical protein